MDDNDKLAELEKQLDDAMAEKYELERQLKSDSMIRYELEEIIRSIYYECRNILKEEGNKPDLEIVLSNLSENIRKLTKDYNIRL